MAAASSRSEPSRPTVATVMSRPVITMGPDASFRELVGTMVARDLDALPVIDATGTPVGVVTETDVLAKFEYHGGTDCRPLLAGSRRARWRKSSASTAADLMTTPVVTATEDTRLDTAARTLADQHLRRLYVVDTRGHLAGVLARQDILRLLLRSDGELQVAIEGGVIASAHGARQVTVRVRDGIVTLRGTLALRSTAEQVYRTTHHVPGVVAVRNDLRYELDDLALAGL